MKKGILRLLLLMLLVINANADKRAMTVEDMWQMKRIGDIQLAPDGKQIAFSVTEYSMEENRGKSDIWLMTVDGKNLKKLTSHEKSSTHPRWNTDGSSIGFLSDRNGSQQIFVLSVHGGEAQQLSHFPVDVESFVWSPDGKKIAFSAKVYSFATTLQESAEYENKQQNSKVKATVTDILLYRHWNEWTEGKRSHVFVCDDKCENVIDLTPGDYDSPPIGLEGSQDFVFSPDGAEIAFVSNRTKMPAINTNNDLFIVSSNGGESRCLTESNKGVDNQPLYSPDGKYLVYRSMKRPGFEADQYEIVLYNRQNEEKSILTESFDLSPDEIIWAPESNFLYFNTSERGRKTVYSLDIENKKTSKLVQKNANSGLNVSFDGTMLYFKRQSNVHPFEIFSLNLEQNEVVQLSNLNENILSQLELNPVEDFEFKSFDGSSVHGLLVKPPFFDSAKKYPMVFLIHGGPQGMWSDDFHYRWNSSLFAAPGYVVAMINFRGSKGYGQKWCDAVSKDWGEGPYKDLLDGLDYLLMNYQYIDKNKIVAAGASYGGFMVNWIATHCDKFKALVTHAGVFDQKSMYGATEELWFPEWEFDGTPYENPKLYEKYSPLNYVKNLAKYKTPTLVIHGQHDYRVPVTQGMQMFTALQRMGVPSRFIYFPDESHFVTKPQNARFWWTEVFNWFEKWINN